MFVGGSTSHDSDAVALSLIQDVWTSGQSQSSIVNTLTASGGLLEVGQSVSGDGEKDNLEGHKKSVDLFFAELGTDKLKGDDNDDTVIGL